MRRPSEDSDSQEFVDGPIQHKDVAKASLVDASFAATASKRMQTSDREELMERIKRGESPTWVPSRAVSKLLGQHGLVLHRPLLSLSELMSYCVEA